MSTITVPSIVTGIPVSNPSIDTGSSTFQKISHSGPVKSGCAPLTSVAEPSKAMNVIV